MSARVKSVDDAENLTVFGVSNKEGICVTGKEVSADVSNYIYVKGRKFAYNPYRINVGSIGLAEEDFEGIVSPAYVVFETGEDINDEFLFLYLRSPLGINLISWYGNRGGVRSALRFQDLEKIDFPDLTYDQQTKALEIIREQFEKIDDVSEELWDQKSLIEKLRQSILQDAIQGKLVLQDSSDEPASELLKRIKVEKDQLIAEKKIKKSKPLPPITDEEKPFDLPQSWLWCRLDDVINIGSSKRIFEKDYVPEGIPFFRSKEIGQLGQGKDITTELFIETERYEAIKSRFGVPKSGDILIACIGGSIGNTWMVDDRTFYYKDGNLVLFDSHNLLSSKYLLHFLNSRTFFDGALGAVSGSAYNALTIEKIKKTPFPLPPLDEQQRAVNKIEELMQFCDELEEQMQQSAQLGKKLSQSVLQQAFVAS